MVGDGLADSALIASAEAGTQEQAWGFERFFSEQELRDYLLQAAVAQWQHLFGRVHSQYVGLPPYVLNALNAVETGTQAAVVSNTNLQVAGVDEADLVKTDGEYLYMLRGDELLILDVRPAALPQLVSRTPVGQIPTAMYLNGDRLTVIAHEYEPSPDQFARSPLFSYTPRAVGVKVTVYDISHRAHPAVHRQTLLDGRYVQSRQIDERLVFVLQNDFELPAPLFLPDSDPPTNEVPDDDTGIMHTGIKPILVSSSRLQSGRYETREEYLARIGDRVLELALPHYHTIVPGGTEQRGLLNEASEIYRPLSSRRSSLVSIVVLDASGAAETPLSSASLPNTSPYKIYVSSENIYVFDPWGGESKIHKFYLDASDVELVAVGSVSGMILNHFSVDEHQGFLRIATTRGWGFAARNNIYVLHQEGSQLEITGRLEGLAPGEGIYAVRFLGARGFVVTFRQKDPLFAIDLSNPAQPRVAGELHIPGFADYLHPVGENHLIGIGRNADLTGRQEDLQVSLFDVSNLGDPRLIGRFSIDGGRRSDSAARFDHHAVSYFSDRQTLAIPVSTLKPAVDIDGDGRADEQPPPRSEMWVFDVDTTVGLSLQTRIELKGRMMRSMRIDDVLYLISTEIVSANSLTDPSIQLAEIDLDGPVASPIEPVPTLLPVCGEVAMSDASAFDEPVVVAGVEAGSPPEMRVLDPEALDERLTSQALDRQLDSSELARYFALSAGRRGGVRPVAVDDGEGGFEIVVATASNGRLVVRTIDGLAGTEKDSLVFVPPTGSRVEFQGPLAPGDTWTNLLAGADPLSVVDALFARGLWE